jgi:hypothetical protein
MFKMYSLLRNEKKSRLISVSFFKFSYTHIFQFLCLLLLPISASAQNLNCDATTLNDFFNCYGGQSQFTPQSIEAITAFIQAEDAIQAGQYAQAKILVDNVFNTYPKGDNSWWNLYSSLNGSNIGTPHGYYGLRMLEDIIDHGINGDPNVVAKRVNMSIVLVGCSEGIEPTTEQQLQNGTGNFVTHNIDTNILSNDYRIIRQSFDFFSRYVTAITKGAIEVELQIIEIDQLCLPVGVTTTLPYLAYSGIDPVWGELSQVLKDSTDWWWILYPSHVPDYPTFDDEAFITGGMGADNKGGPVFIIDDLWLTKKHPHLGNGKYSDIERRIYLPQWLQHEFYHHLYRIYPELELEVNGHDWFNINFWPSDFEGQFETDYYSETLHKRLQVDCTPLSTKLITRLNQNDLSAQFSTFSMNELLGNYSKDVIQNPWHEADIIFENGQFFWKNTANVQWTVTPNFAEGKLETGADSPYPGQDFLIELFRTSEGDYISGAIALKYQGEIYRKRTNLLRETTPIEVALGTFERVPAENTQHTGSILKNNGLFSWQNDAGIQWSLTANTTDELFSHNSDSPTPSEHFDLVLFETNCGIYGLGFKYLEHYYWKPKRSLVNESPVLTNSISNLILPQNFGTHTINLSDVFADPTGDSLLYFVTSEQSSLISANINNQELTLSGGALGNTTIYLMAIDANGGLAVNEFNVEVSSATSIIQSKIQSNIAIFPHVTQDFVNITGETVNYDISLISIDNAYHQNISVLNNNSSVDLSHLSSGMYLLMLTDRKTNITKAEKVIKY